MDQLLHRNLQVLLKRNFCSQQVPHRYTSCPLEARYSWTSWVNLKNKSDTYTEEIIILYQLQKSSDAEHHHLVTHLVALNWLSNEVHRATSGSKPERSSRRYRERGLQSHHSTMRVHNCCWCNSNCCVTDVRNRADDAVARKPVHCETLSSTHRPARPE